MPVKEYLVQKSFIQALFTMCVISKFLLRDVITYILIGLPFNRTRIFQGSDRRTYEWTLNGHDLHVSLWPFLDLRSSILSFQLDLTGDSKIPIARFYHSTGGIFTMKHNQTLEIFPEGVHIVDDIIITFLYMDKLRQDLEKERKAATQIEVKQIDQMISQK
jgi:hypothetical protein